MPAYCRPSSVTAPISPPAIDKRPSLPDPSPPPWQGPDCPADFYRPIFPRQPFKPTLDRGFWDDEE